MAASIETITLGGGCFWCTEAVYERVSGVTAVESGYSNGHVKNPSYEQVCGGDTGHNEVVRVSFDPSMISLREVLEIFFVIHDPTTLNRQGNDVGTQYRSGIYFHSAEQERVAREVLAEVNAHHGGRVVTEVRPRPTTRAPRPTTSTTSRTTRTRATARWWWRRRWRSFAKHSPAACGPPDTHRRLLSHAMSPSSAMLHAA